jgi:hypothetical protein
MVVILLRYTLASVWCSRIRTKALTQAKERGNAGGLIYTQSADGLSDESGR